MKITWFGTASLAVETAAGRLLADPFFPMKGSPTRVARDAYRGYQSILVTHGHFDHILSLPAILRESGATVWCTETPYRTLQAMDVPEDNLRLIAPGDAFEREGMRVTVYRSRHVEYDARLLRRTFLNPRMLRHAGNLPLIASVFRAMPENGETVAYHIEAEGRSLMILGSLNLAEGVDYPAGMDLLALPYQGTSDLLTPGLHIVERLRPRAVLLDHFDDAFPPISSAVDTSDIQQALSGRLPVYRLEPGGSLEL